jgi:hypothetical protein
MGNGRSKRKKQLVKVEEAEEKTQEEGTEFKREERKD